MKYCHFHIPIKPSVQPTTLAARVRSGMPFRSD